METQLIKIDSCPCGARDAEYRVGAGDNTIIKCKACPPFKASSLLLALLRSGMLMIEDTEAFRKLVVEAKDSEEWPTITEPQVRDLLVASTASKKALAMRAF